jgi:hypothetical protein
MRSHSSAEMGRDAKPIASLAICWCVFIGVIYQIGFSDFPGSGGFWLFRRLQALIYQGSFFRLTGFLGNSPDPEQGEDGKASPAIS